MKLQTWLGATAVVVCCALQAQEMSDEDIAERIKPVGSLQMAGDEAAGEAAGGGASGPRSGEAVYNAACVNCHASGVLGAPKHRAAEEWQPRLDERGFDQIWQNAINGYNAMPPKGACNDCSDDEIKAAIEYMIEGI